MLHFSFLQLNGILLKSSSSSKMYFKVPYYKKNYSHLTMTKFHETKIRKIIKKKSCRRRDIENESHQHVWSPYSFLFLSFLTYDFD